MSDIDRQKWNQRYRQGAYAGRVHASALLQDWVEKIPPGRALDVACGAGRNALFLAGRGFAVDAVDISREALERAGESAHSAALQVNWLERDLDEGLALETGYQLILVIRYVNLPLLRQLTDNLAPGGFLVCEQHLVSDADVTGPGNPAYRVNPGELAACAGELQVHWQQEGLVAEPDGGVAALSQLVAQRH